MMQVCLSIIGVFCAFMAGLSGQHLLHQFPDVSRRRHQRTWAGPISSASMFKSLRPVLDRADSQLLLRDAGDRRRPGGGRGHHQGGGDRDPHDHHRRLYHQRRG
ncbi:MAG: hypothetical protein MZU95_15820 [Desulfomicrobium escambiense]|nr:hypothetical protein [Desulfomicrobium escambiense]